MKITIDFLEGTKLRFDKNNRYCFVFAVYDLKTKITIAHNGDGSVYFYLKQEVKDGFGDYYTRPILLGVCRSQRQLKELFKSITRGEDLIRPVERLYKGYFYSGKKGAWGSDAHHEPFKTLREMKEFVNDKISCEQ